MKIHHKKHKRDGIGLIQKPSGHKEVRASFPNQIHTRSNKSINQIYSKEKNRGRGTGGAAAWEIEQFTDEIQTPHLT